jgi:hypothetical protein
MENIKFVIEKSSRIQKLINELYEKMPEIETSRGVLVTESYMATENLPIVKRRSAAFSHILKNIPIRYTCCKRISATRLICRRKMERQRFRMSVITTMRK